MVVRPVSSVAASDAENEDPPSPASLLHSRIQGDGIGTVGTDLEANRVQNEEKEPDEERLRRRSQPPRSSSIAARTAAAPSSFLYVHNGSFDDAVLHRAVADAGQWAYGIALVEVWVLNRQQTYLSRAERGWWIHPSFAASTETSSAWQRDLLQRLTDTPSPVAPGEGLPGVLWSEARQHYDAARGRRPWGRDSLHASRRSSVRTSVASALVTSAFSPSSSGAVDLSLTATRITDRYGLIFRDAAQIAVDPDQPYHPRLQALVDLGLGWAAAAPIHQGLVLFLARRDAPLSRLQSSPNRAYLAAASYLIEAAYHLREPRIAAEEARRQEVRHAWLRVRSKVVALRRLGVNLADYVRKQQSAFASSTAISPPLEPLEDKHVSCWNLRKPLDWTVERVVWAARKARGGGGTPPPRAHWNQTLFIFVGVFGTLAAVTNYSALLARSAGIGRPVVPLGPFGALVTLLYGLTMAPASQPRNALLGQAVSLPIGLAFASATALPPWLRLSLAPAVAVALTAHLGVLHPPAGASAIILAGGGFGWDSVWATLVGTVLAVTVATIANNLSAERQYPMYWTGVAQEGCTPTLWRQRGGQGPPKQVTS